MSRKGENIYKRKDGRWEGRYVRGYNSGSKAVYGYLYGKTYTEVKAKLKMIVADRQTSVSTASNSLLFSDIAQMWLQKSRRNCKISTINKYCNVYDRILAPAFGAMPITDIKKEQVESFIDRILTSGRRDGKAFSPKTAQDICMVFKQIIVYAGDMYQVQPQFPMKLLTVKQRPREIDVLSDAEIKTLTKYLQNNTDAGKRGVLIALYTGVRVGELCALQWRDFSVPDNTIRVCKTAQRIQLRVGDTQKTALQVSSPKSACSDRVIPLPAFLMHLLVPLQASGDTYIMTGTGECLDPRVMQLKFKSYLAACGLRAVPFHALRHTFATKCIELGFDVKTLSEILGHASVNVTLNRYVHSSTKMKKQSMMKLDAGF